MGENIYKQQDQQGIDLQNITEFIQLKIFFIQLNIKKIK